ncbi:MAG: hypothetical protein BM564_07840 [Bacteroidetes bacterium MedPE-SWsnd-G2]|nr:MAG: hypothetical protein BM564_07840 [Bacteroidetes bacterium MedPE-SWsnd-G2]
MNFSIKRIAPHLVVLLGFVVLALAYFYPVLQGKQIYQSDIAQYIGMAKQQNDFRKENHEETYWTNSAFGGMPTYQLGAKYPHNYIKKLDLTLRFLPRPADYLMLYLAGFYVLMLVLKVDYRLAALGAIGFGFSTYLIIILGVGHNSKAHAIAYMPLVLSGILLTFQKKYIAGFLLATVALALEICANHFQMTYYLLLLVLVLGVSFLIDAYKTKTLPHFFKSVGLLTVAAILAVGLNATNIMATQEYAKESTRSKSELTISPDRSPKPMTSGLDKGYITEYSYGKLESFNLFIPRLFGGGSYENVGPESATYSYFKSLGATSIQALNQAKRTPTYWGDQPIVEAPAYIGAVMLFLFVFALFVVKGKLKWWLVGGSVMSLLLSWGKNFGLLTDFFIDFVPLYDKFRAVSSIQVILELCVPILGVLGMVYLFNSKKEKEPKLKALKYTAAITAGLAVAFLLFKSMFDFSGVNDSYYRQNYGLPFIDAVREDRISFYFQDTFRTLILVSLVAGCIYLYLTNKLKEKVVMVAMGVLLLFDLVMVDQRYVNAEDFVSASRVNRPYDASPADLEILKDKSHYRVFDITSGGARASYFHNSLSGYHAAKMKRYNDVFDFHISKNNLSVLNMLNTKYIIAQDEENGIFPYTNEEANGNAWFVAKLNAVNSPDEEIVALDSLNTKSTALVDVSRMTLPNATTFSVDENSNLSLVAYKPNYLKYESINSQSGFAVFSEVYYKDGWQAYIDGNKVDHLRVNYILRGLEVPEGTHDIEFKFEPAVISTGSSIALASSLSFGLLILLALGYQFKQQRRKS